MLVEASDGNVAVCFQPRHGLRVGVDGIDWELLICYECLSMHVYRDGVHLEGHLTSGALEPQMTALFAAAGLKIHRDAE